MPEPWQLPTDRVPLETEEQKDYIRWFRRTFPGVRIFAVPNGGKRSESQGNKLKQEGVSSGVPDLYSPGLRKAEGGGVFGLWIEMKRTKGSVTSPEQLDWHAYLRSIGHCVIVPKGSLEAQRMTLEWINQRT